MSRRTPPLLRDPRLAAALVVAFALGVALVVALLRDPGRVALPAPVTSGVLRPEVLSDGAAALAGDAWDTDRTSVFTSPRSRATWDLGGPTHVVALALQADANDRYLFEGSVDGAHFAPLWEAPPSPRDGMRSRGARDLDATVRWLRLSASGGDGRYAVSEVAVYDRAPRSWPPSWWAWRGRGAEGPTHDAIALFAFVSLAWALLAPWSRAGAAMIALPLLALARVAIAWRELPVIIEREETLMRAAVATVAAALLVRAWVEARRGVRSRAFTDVPLAGAAVLALACWYHFGQGQFWDAREGQRTHVHFWDMRVYHPVAKYFPELRFDGLYLASVAAYLDETGVSPESIGATELRSLRDNQMQHVRDVMPEIDAVRARFTPARWAELRRDMRWFVDGMGAQGFLDSLRDHGGNATPAWLLGANLLYRWFRASDGILLLGGALDPLALAALWVVVARTFGLRVALVSAIVWGTSDFQRFGTNLVGSTLRYDWMVAVGLAACALRARREALAGALLAYAALIRAFPAAALFGLALPAIAALVGEMLRARSLPAWSSVRAELVALRRVVAGAAIATFALVAASSALPGFHASWELWARKIVVHADKPNVNSVGLRNVMAFEPAHVGEKVIRPDLAEPWADWQAYQRAALARRRPLHLLVVAAFVAAAAWACRRRELHRAALVGLALVPVLFYPANYYMHCVFLLPLLASDEDRELPLVGGLLLGLCIAQYATLSERWGDVCYFEQSALLLGVVAALIAWLGRAAKAAKAA